MIITRKKVIAILILLFIITVSWFLIYKKYFSTYEIYKPEGDQTENYLKFVDISSLFNKSVYVVFKEKNVIGIWDNKMIWHGDCKINNLKLQNETLKIYLDCVIKGEETSGHPIYIKLNKPIPKNIKIIDGSNYSFIRYPEEKFNLYTHKFFEEQLKEKYNKQEKIKK
jgi:hypothetical protein